MFQKESKSTFVTLRRHAAFQYSKSMLGCIYAKKIIQPLKKIILFYCFSTSLCIIYNFFQGKIDIYIYIFYKKKIPFVMLIQRG